MFKAGQGYDGTTSIQRLAEERLPECFDDVDFHGRLGARAVRGPKTCNTEAEQSRLALESRVHFCPLCGIP